MQNLINLLLQPKLGEDKPSTLNRRAAEALANVSNMQKADLQGRLIAEEESRQLLSMVDRLKHEFGPSNHEEVYREVMNKDYELNFL